MKSKNPTLTRAQKKAAQQLLALRPQCYPGTRFVISDDNRKAWYDVVATVAVANKVSPEQTPEFMDLAGVPD